MKKRIAFLIACISLFTALLFSLSGCGATTKVKEVAPYIFEADTYTSLDYKFAEEYFAKEYYNWGGGCSAVVKTLDDGHTVIGRNMDLNISNKCAYVVRTNVKGDYKTIGLQYTFRDVSPNYEKVKKEGLDETFSKILPFMCDDIINDQGLYIEINMRNAEKWPGGQDKFACSGTNVFSNQKVYMFAVSRYIAQKCATVEEAVTYAKTLNVYSKNDYWNYSFMIADAFGNYGVLEFAMNMVLWHPNANIQTNFYIDELISSMQDTKTGIGRYNVLKEGIDKVETKEQMYDLISNVSYFQFYDPYNCKFDPRSENIGTFAGATYEFVMNDDYKDEVYMFMDAYGKPIRESTREQLRVANAYWESTFTEVADCIDKSILVRFYENNDLKYLLTFDGFTKV